jgi:hypothetical protein
VDTEDSTIACNTVAPNAPAGTGVSVNADIATAQGAYFKGQAVNAATGTTLGSAGADAWWVSQVAPWGNWDYKEQWNPACGNDEGCLANNAYFGNFDYGATCYTMGMSQETCQRGAGAAAYGTAGLNVLRGGNWTAGPGNPVGSPVICKWTT